MTFQLMRQSAGLVQGLLPDRDQRVCWQEFQNKLEAFTSFAYVESGAADRDLSGAIASARSLGPYAAVWSMEGLGYREAERCWRHGVQPRMLISSDLSEDCLIPLHAGVGLSLACRTLESDRPLADRLGLFLDLCHANAVAGYLGVVFEALGLIARNLYPELVPAIDRLLEGETDLLGFFWHGIGRGIYFVPTNFPVAASAPWRSVAMARSEAPHEWAALNSLSGLVWAFTLINLRHPEIQETFLEYHGEELLTSDAYWNGLGSSLLAWRTINPEDPSMKMFAPEPNGPWQPGELFRYRDRWYGFPAN